MQTTRSSRLKNICIEMKQKELGEILIMILLSNRPLLFFFFLRQFYIATAEQLGFLVDQNLLFINNRLTSEL